MESTFEVGRRFRCTMRVDRGQLEPGAGIRPEPGEWHPRMPERGDRLPYAFEDMGEQSVKNIAKKAVSSRWR
jgi:hypothetical protein